MTADTLHLLHQAFFGAIAAAGFGILFNFGWCDLPWCAVSGAIALATRTLGQSAGWSQEAASFVAAGLVGGAARLLRARLGITGNTLAVAGCIPMVPGSFVAQAFFGLYALTAANPVHPDTTALVALEFMLRAMFTVVAIGAGLSIATHVLNGHDSEKGP